MFRSALCALLGLASVTVAVPALRAQTPTDTLATPPPSTGPDPEANEPDAGDPGSIDDGTEVVSSEVSIRPRLSPSALYSANRGFGIGGGIGISNFGWRGSEIGLDLRAQQRYLSAGLSVYTGDPYDNVVYGSFAAVASTTNRRQFYGVGPFTSGNEPLYIEHNDFIMEGRVGVYPLGNSGLFINPGIRFRADRSGDLNENSPAQIADFDPASQIAVTSGQNQTRYGVSAGLEVASDLRDWPAYPRSGTFASVEARRFFGLDASKLRFSRYSAQTIGYLPLYGRTTLIASAIGIVTRSGDSDGDGASDPIPYYYLPDLDDEIGTPYRQDRLTARDVFAVGLGVRAPIYDFLGVYGFDALIVGYLGNAYDNVFRQFSPRVSFSNSLTPDSDSRAALRPALGIGLGLVNLDKERVVLGALVGIGAGGVSLATLSIAYNLRDSRALFR